MNNHEQYKKCFIEYKHNIEDIEKLSCELLEEVATRPVEDKKDNLDVYNKVYIINQKAHNILRIINAYF
tara:strand:- start:876 stop:1082 length:207 start_codon:yes stop_codon:yes gene_type:complete